MARTKTVPHIPADIPTNKTLSFPEAGQQLGVSVTTVRNLVQAGKLKTVTLSMRPRILSSSIDELLKGAQA